jgi:hypothetical protein
VRCESRRESSGANQGAKAAVPTRAITCTLLAPYKDMSRGRISTPTLQAKTHPQRRSISAESSTSAAAKNGKLARTVGLWGTWEGKGKRRARNIYRLLEFIR